jgi:hypothetical protein
VRGILWLAQWFAVVLVPAWLVVGTTVFSGGGLSVAFIMVVSVPIVLVALLTAATLSVTIPSARRTRGGPRYVRLLAASWVCIGVQALLIQGGFDVITPSGFERLGLSEAADDALVSFFLWAAAVLLTLACISTALAGSAPPFGDGSDRALRRQELHERDSPDDLNRGAS